MNSGKENPPKIASKVWFSAKIQPQFAFVRAGGRRAIHLDPLFQQWLMSDHNSLCTVFGRDSDFGTLWTVCLMSPMECQWTSFWTDWTAFTIDVEPKEQHQSAVMLESKYSVVHSYKVLYVQKRSVMLDRTFLLIFVKVGRTVSLWIAENIFSSQDLSLFDRWEPWMLDCIFSLYRHVRC